MWCSAGLIGAWLGVCPDEHGLLYRCLKGSKLTVNSEVCCKNGAVDISVSARFVSQLNLH
jgi:hypothetical protein